MSEEKNPEEKATLKGVLKTYVTPGPVRTFAIVGIILVFSTIVFNSSPLLLALYGIWGIYIGIRGKLI